MISKGIDIDPDVDHLHLDLQWAAIFDTIELGELIISKADINAEYILDKGN